MRLTSSRASLTAAFQAVSGVVPSRTTKEVLKNVKLQSTGQAVTLLGTDSEVGLRCKVSDVTVDLAGETLLPTARVLQVLRELTSDDVSLEIAGNAVWIRGGSSEFRLSAEDPADFPPVAEFDDADFFTVNAPALRQLIRRTVFACDTESTRYALGGLLVELTPERATLAATDGRRLAVASTACAMTGQPTPPTQHPVVPSKAMVLLERLLGDKEGDVKIALHPHDIMVQAGDYTISSQLVQGRFPDYRKVIPAEFAQTIEMVVGPFYSAIRQAQIVTNEDSRGVNFTLTAGTLRLSSQAADIGQSKVEIPISYDGPELTITFDPRYVADFLRVLEPSSGLRWQVNDGEGASVMSADDHYTYVIMPLSRE
jgi:DNA polymerase III subunit beta